MRISDWSSDVCSSDLIAILCQQVEQRRHVHARRERIDRGGLVFIGDLDQAEFGPIAVFAHELGVHHHERCGGEAAAKVGEGGRVLDQVMDVRSEEHTSELQSLMRNSNAVLCFKKKNNRATKE